MKVTYPLSLKVSLWLVANLLLLAVLGVGFFVVQGGLGWSALVAGMTGDRAQAKMNIIAAEFSAATVANRNAVLERFKSAFGAEFFAFRNFEGQIGGATIELPDELKGRLEIYRRTPRWPFGRGFGPPGGGGQRGGFGPPSEGGYRTREKGEKDGAPRREPPEGVGIRRESPPDGARREPPEFGGPEGGPGVEGGPDRRPEPPDPAREREFGRFIVRVGSPPTYWLGMRAFIASERGRPAPGMIVAKIDSFWHLLRFLDLHSWLMAAGGVLLLSVVFWLPLVRHITHSVGQLTAATEQIAEGRLETRVSTSRRDEIGKLGESVNRMAARIDAHMTGQKRFLGDVAHELCSPIARLQMATGILAEQAPKDLQDTVVDVRDEVQQMSTLVNELLAFTKSGMQPRDVALAAIDLEPLARQVLAREGAGERVSVDIAPHLRVMADADLLSRALGNLIRNALRYADAGGPIRLGATQEGTHVIIAVEDEGPGVPAADLDRLGEPFFRPELARTREGGGVGLGLAIVRNSVAACHGEVRFANRSPHGFRAEIRLAAT